MIIPALQMRKLHRKVNLVNHRARIQPQTMDFGQQTQGPRIHGVPRANVWKWEPDNQVTR